MENEEELITAHKFTSNNKKYILASERCGCFYCLNTFPASRVREWINDGTRARCPFCSVDSVLPSNTCDVSVGFLRRMNEYWFKSGKKFNKAEWEAFVRENKIPSPKRPGDN